MADTLERAVEASEIVDALKSFGVTQVDVAAVVQVSDRAVRGWRTGDIRPYRYDRLAQLRDLVLLLSPLRGGSQRGRSLCRRLVRVSLGDAVATAPRRRLTGSYWHQGTTRHPLTSCADPALGPGRYHRTGRWLV